MSTDTQFRKAVFNGEGKNVYDASQRKGRAVFGGEGVPLDEEKRLREERKAQEARQEKQEQNPIPPSQPQTDGVQEKADVPRVTKAVLRDQIRQKAQDAGVKSPDEKWLNSSQTSWAMLNDFLNDEKNFVNPEAKKEEPKTDEKKEASTDENKSSEDEEKAKMIAEIVALEGPPDDIRQGELNSMQIADLKETLIDLKGGEDDEDEEQ